MVGVASVVLVDSKINLLWRAEFETCVMFRPASTGLDHVL